MESLPRIGSNSCHKRNLWVSWRQWRRASIGRGISPTRGEFCSKSGFQSESSTRGFSGRIWRCWDLGNGHGRTWRLQSGSNRGSSQLGCRYSAKCNLQLNAMTNSGIGRVFPGVWRSVDNWRRVSGVFSVQRRTYLRGSQCRRETPLECCWSCRISRRREGKF